MVTVTAPGRATPFERATTVVPIGESSFSWQVSEGWQQGRGAWGGAIVGALLRAITASEPDVRRRVRSVTAQLVAPAVVGPHRIDVRPIRSGSAVSVWTSDAVDAGGLPVATLTAVLGSARAPGVDVARWGRLSPPTVPTPADVPEVAVGPPLAPEFMRNLRMRPISGTPLEGGVAETTGWVRLAQPGPHGDESLIAMVDAWWPCAVVAATSMRGFTTASFAANLLVDPSSLDPDEEFLHHGVVTAAADGYTSEHRRLWTADGRLAVDNLQSIVVIR